MGRVILKNIFLVIKITFSEASYWWLKPHTPKVVEDDRAHTSYLNWILRLRATPFAQDDTILPTAYRLLFTNH